MQIQSIDPENIRLLRAKLNAAVKEEADKLGLTVSFGNASYNNASVTLKANVSVGNAEEALRREFERECCALKAQMIECIDEALVAHETTRLDYYSSESRKQAREHVETALASVRKTRDLAREVANAVGALSTAIRTGLLNDIEKRTSQLRSIKEQINA